MGFQILNRDKEPISMKELDAEAVALWGVEPDEKMYAGPLPKPPEDDMEAYFDWFRSNGNWFDQIGYRIHRHNIYDWDDLKALYISNLIFKFSMEKIMAIPVVAGYLKLIDHWASKGYTCKSVPD
jgi:hypothetical protein